MGHVPVLLNEAVAALNLQSSGVYVDGTFGRGGHAQAILTQLGEAGTLIALDRDPEAANAAQIMMQKDHRLRFVQTRFSLLAEALRQQGVAQVDGVLLDLGISSPQIDQGERGFSFRQDAPLDMRMDPTQGESAADFLARASQQHITKVLKNYGEERFAPSIARAIVAAREERPIRRTGELAKIVAQSLGARVRGDWQQDPATRTFQALRIQVNEEFEEIMRALPIIVSLMKAGARLAVISFHSLEDRLVKRFIARASRTSADDDALRHMPIKTQYLPEPMLKVVGRTIKASAKEVASNTRARSAILRVAERTHAPFDAAEMKRIERDAFAGYERA